MKDLNYLNKYRCRHPLCSDLGDEHNGVFLLWIGKERYTVIASDGGGWEHVSISHEHKTPSWDTMCAAKDMFFEEEETVMQLHPPKSQYINNHKHCLHLWRPIDGHEIPAPPAIFVGTRGFKP